MKIPPHIILPDSGQDLLRQELALAFEAAGFRVFRAHPAALQGIAPPPDAPAPQNGILCCSLASLLEQGPALLFSVNFQGIGPIRQTLELLERHNSHAAVWCVDNPWNLLAGVRDPRWKSLPLFVTDASFLGPLRQHGAEKVFHLPLAACPALFAPDAKRDADFPPPPGLAPFVFVGRSAFPGKETFFAGQSLPKDTQKEAKALLLAGQRPDLSWWEKKLDESALTPAPLSTLAGHADRQAFTNSRSPAPADPASRFWPGKKARRPALGAEETNLVWRALCLHEAALAGTRLATETAAHAQPGALQAQSPAKEPTVTKNSPGLDIFGDAGWQAHMPRHACLHSAVDYYARLPGIYAAARYNICLTSLQLPQGLNQRHFDVWTAGGLCLTDATPGLSLFPGDLTRPITFTRAQDIHTVAEQLEKSHSRPTLIADWQACLLSSHTYAHRVQAVIEYIFLI